MKDLTPKRLILLAVAVAILIFGSFLPAPEGLSEPGKMTLVILLYVFVMIVGKVVPTSIASISAMLMLPFVGAVGGLNDVYGHFVNGVFFFLLAIFGITAIFGRTDIPSRIMRAMLKAFGNKTKAIVFAFGATTFIISAFISDLAATALMAGILVGITKKLDLPDQFLKCTLMLIPAAAVCGGRCMPISSITNVTIMQLLENSLGQTVPFFQWMIVGTPAAIVAFLITYFCIIFTVRPANMDEAIMVRLTEEFSELPPMDLKTKKSILLLAVLMVFWIMGSWVKIFDSNLVALCGLIVMFLPKIDLLTFEEYKEDVPLDLLLMLGAMFSLCFGIQATGTIDWLVGLITGGSGWSPLSFYFIVSIAMVLIRAFIPNVSPILAMVTPGIMAIGAAVGLDAMTMILFISFWCAGTWLFPTVDAMWLMTMRTGKYTLVDYLKWGIPCTILLVVVMAFLLPPLASLSYVAAV